MSSFWSPVVSRLTPYVPGEQPKVANLTKLNTNENPWPPSPHVIEAIREQADERLRLYPPPESDALRMAIAGHHGLSPAQIFVGNGSDEVLAIVFQSLLKHPAPVVFPDITYSFYPVYCALYEIDSCIVPLDDSFAIRVDDLCAANGGRNGGIIFPNPNAPTGRLLPLAELERLLTANRDSVVVVDEAYVDFGGNADPATIPTAIGMIGRFPNLLVVQTLSKSRSLAGLRIGFAAGHADLIEALSRVKNSFNSYPLDRLAIVGAVAALEDAEHFERTRQAVIATRDTLTTELRSLGFEVLPSAANFIFARHPQHDAAQLALALREQNIIVRHFKLPRIDQFLRITVGTEAECAALTAALRGILQ